MQRTQRAKAGNIYKKRLEEIQMEAPRPKPKKAKKKSTNAKPSINTKNGNRSNTKRTGSRTSQSSSNGQWEGEDPNEYVGRDVSLEEPVAENEFDDDYSNMRHGSKSGSNSNSSPSSSSRTTPTSRADFRLRKSLLSKFNCPHCNATFAEERYVEFHCKEVHRNLVKEEKMLIKKTVQEARSHYKQLSRANNGHLMGQPAISTGRDSDSNNDDGQEGEGGGVFDLLLPLQQFDSNELNLNEEEYNNMEDYYERVETDDVDMYRCKKCANFQVASKHVIASHVQRHLAVTPSHRCPYCSYQANNRASLEIHIYTHTGVKPFCCKICDLSFKCMTDLLNHSQTAHNRHDIGTGMHESVGEKSTSSKPAPKSKAESGQVESGPSHSFQKQQQQHKCPYCTQRFMSLVNLETHINSHKIKGLTDEEKEEELRTRGDRSRGTGVEGEVSSVSVPAASLPPPRLKRRSETAGSANAKKAKDTFNEDDPYGQIKRSMINEGPPRCKICSKVFLYTTSIEKHMVEVHNIQTPEVPKPKPTRFSPEKASITIDSTETLITPSSPPPLTPIITSVTSRAGAAEAVTIDGGHLPAFTQAAGTSSNGVKKSPPLKPIAGTTQAAQISFKPRGPNAQPLKSVYLLYDPAKQTVTPISTSDLGVPLLVGKEQSGGAGGAKGEQKLTNEDAIAQGSEDVQPLDDTQADLLVEQEIATELQRLGKPGTPLFEGADNQNLEHECSICQAKIVGYTEIVKHFHTHTIGENYVCHFCDKRFSSKSSLGVHYLIHVGITFSCPLCHKKLAKKQSLLEHIRFHQGQRRFVCSICGKAFITSSSLNRHARMHGSSLPLTQPAYTCDQCHRGFEDQQTFVHHLRAHKVMNSHRAPPNSDPSSMQPMSCRFCDTIWGSSLGLSRHIKSTHGSLLAQPPPSSSPFVEPSTSTAGKNIEVIDLSDDDEQPGGNGTAESGMVVPEMEIPPISGVSKVNLDGEEVDAIEVVTTVVEGESPMEADKDNFTDPLVQVENSAAASPAPQTIVTATTTPPPPLEVISTEVEGEELVIMTEPQQD